MPAKITPKSKSEIILMKDAATILADILEQLADLVKPGINTLFLDTKAEELCKKYKVDPSFKMVRGYEYTICTGVNDVAVHGIPSKFDVVESGDIISVDMGVYRQGFHADHAVTLAVGKVDENATRLLETGKLCLSAAIMQAKVGNTVGDISSAIEVIARTAGFSPIVQMVGHGIGRKLHEYPEVPCVGRPNTGPVLIPGTVLAIEPMINEYGPQIEVLDDGWTTVTSDGGRSVIFEHTVMVGENKGVVLTKSKLF